MHAYLIIGRDSESINEAIDRVAKKFGSKVLEFPLQKIEDARQLAEFTSLQITEPTAIHLNSVDTATTEALNAFLKNLEEPQDNLIYLLTAQSIYSVLPTIVSRCQVVKAGSSLEKGSATQMAKHFLKKSLGERLTLVDGIKKREEAVTFVEDFLASGHIVLTTQVKGQATISHALRVANKTLIALKANGNVALQLANFCVQIDE